MQITQSCAKCLYDKQKRNVQDEQYLQEIRAIIDECDDHASAPYLVYLFNQVYEKHFGKLVSYKEIKKKYNDLVLSMEDVLKARIEQASDSLITAFAFARVGNFIDFGAMDHVDEEMFVSLFEKEQLSQSDQKVMKSFLNQCERAKTFLLITDNCGEIVVDKLFLEQLHQRFPNLEINILVRGKEVLNDATQDDAEYVGIGQYGEICTNGYPIAGTIYDMLPEETKEIFEKSDVILAKGQGNYESLSKQGRHIFYSFLCKCDLFTERFQVPKYSGIFVEEKN
ncbi:damage-control phosphatase ARMT1 family protein [Faecalicoccus acidiformans]|uniref:damage-control phosphatase ARMT1 family protein n=1 Tax=Faecalicoccus acidiformans TaxID=915173 RepID=UPI002356BC22|nr:ARMT1-like domain-containing protein [Faecalicoccus acidiformans]